MPVVCHDRKSSIVYGNDRKSPIVYNVYEENYSQMKHFRKMRIVIGTQTQKTCHSDKSERTQSDFL